jgi:hypothetical protein
MKKLSLRLEDLAVSTFETNAPAAGRGTVAGHYGTDPKTLGDTCEARTCAGSCGPTDCPLQCDTSYC